MFKYLNKIKELTRLALHLKILKIDIILNVVYDQARLLPVWMKIYVFTLRAVFNPYFNLLKRREEFLALYFRLLWVETK